MWPHHSWLKLFHASPTRKALSKKAQSLGRVYAMALSSKAPQPLRLPSYPCSRSQGLHLSPQGPGASGQPFASSPPILPLLTPQTGLFTLSAMVQPAPTSGPLHLTASLPGLIGVSLESPTLPPSLPSGSVQMSLIKEASPDHPISNNIPSPNHTPYMPDCFVSPIMFLTIQNIISTPVRSVSSHARVEASQHQGLCPVCSLLYPQRSEQCLAHTLLGLNGYW